MAWTQQQQNAIDARDSSIIVSAAAGSGKTAVLTERLVKLLSDPSSGVRADRIIVVTFTNDAAAELKKRLDNKLRLLINEHPEDVYLLKQQTLLQNARISTINSFCFDLLRDNITDQGITSGFSILDDTDDTVIKSQAMEELFDWYTKNDYETISFLYDKFCLKNQTPLIRVINDTNTFLSSVAMSDKWLETAVAEYNKPFEESVYYKRFFDGMIKDADRAVKYAEENIKMLPDIFPERGIEAVEKAYLQAQIDSEKAFALRKLAEDKRYPTDEEISYITKFDKLVVVSAKYPYNKALREIFKLKRNLMKDILKASVDQIAAAKSDFEESGKVAEVLTSMVKKFQDIVWEKKCSRNAISFDDGERLVLEMLADFDENGRIIQSEIARQTAEYYDIIMIDEYQDSNNKEDLIFKMLTKNFKLNEKGSTMYGDNAFLVGDVKQSIYRFRLANPRNFISVMKSSDPYESDSKNRYILLNKNFRSSPQVIDFANFVFTEIMSENCGDINYSDDEKLYFGAEEYTPENAKSRLTQINFINSDPIDDDDTEEVTESVEAEITAGKIAKMIQDGIEVIEKDGSRPCTPHDFCILVRNNRFTKAYVNALERYGIAAKGSDEKGYLKSPEIAVLIDLLRIIANPLQDIPLAAVMVSPMYMFSVDDLAHIKAIDCEKPLFPLVRAAAEGEESIDVSLSLRCKNFLDSLDIFRLDSVTMTIGELISSIYDTTDFISVMQLRNDGEKKRANLRALIQYAINYEESAAAEGSGGLTGFIRHIDRILENGDYEQGKVSASSGNYVTVQTLHKSKGLEYPFVFIAETSVEFKFDSNSVMCSDDGRIGFVLYDKKLMRRYKTFQQKMLYKDGMRDSRSEEMRLLYVGMTRAKQQLFINLNCGEKSLDRVRKLADSCIINNSDISELVSEAKCFSDWIWLSLMMNYKFPEIAEKLELPSEPFGFPANDNEEELFTFNLSDAGDVTVFDMPESKEAIPDNELVERIKAMINMPYDNSLTDVSSKLSVTQITRKFRDDEEFDLKLARPRFISGIKKLTGAERGTAIHTFFQFCDFDKAIKDPAAEIQRLTELGHLTKVQADTISTNKIRAFFTSDLFKRVTAAKSYQREKKFMIAAAQLDIKEENFERIRKSDGMLKGIIDLVYETDDGLVIVDYKSDRGMSEEALKERYTMQLMIYKSALELTSDKPVIGLELYSIELKKEIKIM
ncbi:MAG: helicase-exonuclease AddAB subunit AddA [Ruminococcus sp.]|nr:helicase-exonuclease AddAB subunit AddA [Ruminococcus sp.]